MARAELVAFLEGDFNCNVEYGELGRDYVEKISFLSQFFRLRRPASAERSPHVALITGPMMIEIEVTAGAHRPGLRLERLDLTVSEEPGTVNLWK